jgi:hypothetical protein
MRNAFRIFLLAALGFCCMGDAAFAEEPQAAENEEPASMFDNFELDALIEAEWAQEFRKGDGQKLEISFEPELEIKLPHNAGLTLIGRFYGEGLSHLEPGMPRQDSVDPASRRWQIGDNIDAELREAYVDVPFEKANLRIGKQQVVWGRADGLKVLDVVNPQDFREFILDDYDDSRIPLWTFNLEVPIKGITAQFLWIPDTTTHRIADEHSAYEISAGLPFQPPGLKLVIQDADRPNRFFEDSDVGLKLSGFVGGWDLSLNYLYHYDDFPALERRIRLLALPPQIVVEPTYDRTHLVGATFTNAFGDLTLRGEFGYSAGKLYSTDAILDRDGLVGSDEIAYVLGFDWFGFKDTFVSFQLFQSILTSTPDKIVRDQIDTNVTFSVKRSFRNDTVHLENIWIHNLNHQDGLIRPKIKYDVRDNVSIWGGIDWFYGSEKGVFGQFDHRDRLVMGVEIGF